MRSPVKSTNRRTSAAVITSILSGALLLSACTSGGAGTTPTTPEPTKEAPPTAAETKKEKVDGGEITTAILSDPQGFSDLWATTTTSSDLMDLVGSSLYRYSEKQDLVPDLAVGQPTFSEDKKEMTVKIRTDAKYTDGKPVTADDVVFTYTVAVSPDYTGPRKGTFDLLSKVEKVDESTVKFIFKEPFAGFIDLMAYNLLPKHILGDVPVKEMDKHPFIKAPVGSGPYKLVEWKSSQYLQFVRNDNFYGGKPAIEKITVKVVPDANAMMAQLQSGELNFAGVPVDNLAVIEEYAKKSGKIKLHKGVKTSSYVYVAWNLANPLFEDKKVRQALTMAIDRQGIVDGIVEGQGQIMHSQTPPTYWNYTDNVPKFPFDAEKAKTILAEAGWKDSNGDSILDKDGKKFEFEMQVNQGNKVREKGVTVIQQQLKKIGISVVPRVVEGSAFSKNFQEKKFESIYYGWFISGDPNPKGIWHSAEIEHGLNTISYKNPEVDKLIDEDLRTFDAAKRKELLGKVDAIIAEEQPYTFLYSPTTTMAYPSNLEGFNPARDTLREVEKWYFTK